jgi:hypothetical protein
MSISRDGDRNSQVIALVTTITASWTPSWPASQRKRNLNPKRRDPTYPRVVKQARHNSCRVKGPGHRSTRHPDPVSLVNLRQLILAPENQMINLSQATLAPDLAAAIYVFYDRPGRRRLG